MPRYTFTQEDLDFLEEKHPKGITSVDIVKYIVKRNIKFKEATFRKYVQMNLLFRSKRVGKKGKHRGSHGLYPVDNIRLILKIKETINGDKTLEDVQTEGFILAAKGKMIVTDLHDLMKIIKGKYPNFNLGKLNSALEYFWEKVLNKIDQ